MKRRRFHLQAYGPAEEVDREAQREERARQQREQERKRARLLKRVGASIEPFGQLLARFLEGQALTPAEDR